MVTSVKKDILGGIIILFGCVIVMSGCESEEQMPVITKDYGLVKTIPAAPKLTKLPSGVGGMPEGWVPQPYLEKEWKAIVIHHSGTKDGNATIFDKWHREGNHWEGVGYDFVIGNGTDSGDGQIEVTFRWKNQQPGAHCGGTAGNWANIDGIGICLVGNFDNSQPHPGQMQSLIKLVRFLQERYGIPKSRIYGHRTTPGAHETECPGRNFPMAKLKASL